MQLNTKNRILSQVRIALSDSECGSSQKDLILESIASGLGEMDRDSITARCEHVNKMLSDKFNLGKELTKAQEHELYVETQSLISTLWNISASIEK